MNIEKIEKLASNCFNISGFENLMDNIKENRLNTVRLLVDSSKDELEENYLVNPTIVNKFQFTAIEMLDNIITDELIKKIDDSRR